MRVVSYADEHFLTTDAVAEAVLGYSVVLARSNTSDVVRIPVIAEGAPTWAEIIIGPASQITTIEVENERAELDDAETLRDLEERTRKLGVPGPVGVDPDPVDLTSDVDLPLD
jgi:N-acetyl-beta-hexosaminidase